MVVNHVGYATLADMQTFHFGSLYLQGTEVEKTLGKNWSDWRPGPGQNWHSFNDYINFSDKAGWRQWWGKLIRTDIGDYDSPGYDDLTMSLAFLPDIKTEAPMPAACHCSIATNPTPPRATCPAPPPAIT